VPGRPQIVVGGPGTGKTQFLAERIAWAVRDGSMDPSRIVALAFSRRGVDDMARRLTELIGTDGSRVTIATYHSVAMRIVEAQFEGIGWTRSPTILTAAEQEQYAARVLATESRESWPAGYSTLLDSPVMAAEVTDFILRCHEQLLTPTDLAAMDDERFKAMAGFMTRYNEQLTADSRTDYGRILTEAVTALKMWPEITESYELVAADEYQDTSPAQAEMTFLLAAGTQNLIVAADPYQSIYSFRGTDINNVFSFPHATKDRLGTLAERVVLTTSHRVPAEILDAAVSVTGRALPGGAGKVASARSGGVVESHVFATVSDETEWIASDIERVHLLDGVPLERIAVFMRSRTTYGNDLAAAFERRSIPHSFSESRLADEPIVRFVHDLVIAASSDDEEAHLAMRRVLMSPYVALTYGAVNELARRVEAGESWAEVIAANVPGGEQIAALLEDTSWAFTTNAAQGLWRVWSTVPQLVAVALEDTHQQDRKAWSAFNQVLTRLAERSPGATLSDHTSLASGTDFEADPLYSFVDEADGGVNIGSLHDAKGTEYHIVYVANAIEGALPDLRTRDSLLGTRLLSPHLPTDTKDYVAFRLDEERRLAYTATTRATSRAVWCATASNDPAAGGQPSRFLPLIAAPTEPLLHPDPLTPRSFEAALRRTARDPLESLSRRLAAISVLAQGIEVGLVDPMTRYGMREPGADDSITPETIRLSPSQADSYARCPRKYAIERFLLTRSETTDPMRFGNLIHHILEHAEQVAAHQGRERSTYDEAIGHLEDAWDEHGFGDDAVGLSWKNRAEDTLDNLYTKWPASGTPVAFEKDLRLEISGVDWMGRADRIEQRGSELHVVDYKTSTAAASATDAKSSIQLGFYLLAAMNDPELAELGSFTGAEFWYPRKDPLKHSIVTRSFSMASIDEVRDVLEEITTSIGDEEFPPVVGTHCDTCDVALVCPARDEGREAFVL
jgi:superfamily I DNA/RNA helicase/CRISPR/Cas system-associated exonuclease Cas4 (RecB family)